MGAGSRDVSTGAVQGGEQAAGKRNRIEQGWEQVAGTKQGWDIHGTARCVGLGNKWAPAKAASVSAEGAQSRHT